MQATDPDAQTDLLVPTGFHPEGISEERLAELFDENTRYLLSALLPGRYTAIFVYILKYATISPKTAMQQSLFTSIGESNDCAIVLYKKLDLLAKTKDAPAGPETLLKALVIYEALGIISQRSFHAGYAERYTQIRIPLGKREILIEELLAGLRRAYHEYKDEKIRQLVVKTAKLIQKEEFKRHIPRPVTTSIESELKDHLTRLLAEHGITGKNIRIPALAEACSIISSVCKSGRVLAKTGESYSFSPRRHQKQMGEFGPQTGDSGDAGRQASTPSTKVVVSVPGDSDPSESPVLPKRRARSRAKCLQMGELNILFGQESPESAPNGGVGSYSGDSEGVLSMSVVTSSSFLSSLEDEDTLIDTKGSEKSESPVYVDERDHWEIKEEANLYERKFDQASAKGWKGSLYNTVRSTSRAIRDVAEIATFFYLQFDFPDRKKMFAPGGWFTNACKRYQQSPASIPQEIRIWTESGLSVDEIIKQIRAGKRHPAQMVLLDEGGEVVSGEISAVVEEEYELPATSQPLPVGSGSMSRVEADRLCDRILREGERFNIQAQVIQGRRQGTWVVETVWNGVDAHQISPAHWDRYFADTSACYDE